ncbi:hypothetical protein [Nocardia sp. NPDC004860]|uniref:hypothetical protein n=1 Tax=Nocardia sp. NPDC004860 TaxID=3154557 RepID=UPI0033B8AA6D
MTTVTDYIDGDLDPDDEFACAPTPPGLVVRYHPGWRAYAIWCAAAERRALPTAPLTLLEFLAEHPGAVATQAGRITAVNAAHRAAGLPAPGRAEALRQALDDDRAQRAARIRAVVEALLPQIPRWGWPAGLAGRRNAALLTLAATGLPRAAIAALTVGDVLDGGLVGGREVIHLGTAPWATLSAGDDPDRCPVAALRGWLDVRGALQRYSGHALLAHALENHALPPIPLHSVDAGQPLFVALDRHGYAPTPHTDTPGAAPTLPALGVDSLAAVLTRHLSGQPVRYRARTRPPISGDPAPISEPEPIVEIELGNDYYERGTAARRRDAELLADVDDRLDAVLAQMDDWLTRTDALINDTIGGAPL